MSFLNSVILLGLAAAAIPLLIHLLTRFKSNTIKFSSLEFLKELQLKKIRKLKLRQLLLLLLRMLIIILLVLAFSRPALQRPDQAAARSSNAKTSAAVIVDNSYSTMYLQDGIPLFDTIRQRAKQITSIMNPGDELYLITSTDTSLEESRRAFHDFDIFKQQVDRLEIDYHLTDLSAAVSLAKNALNRSSNINKEIYIV